MDESSDTYECFMAVLCSTKHTPPPQKRRHNETQLTHAFASSRTARSKYGCVYRGVGRVADGVCAIRLGYISVGIYMSTHTYARRYARAHACMHVRAHTRTHTHTTHHHVRAHTHAHTNTRTHAHTHTSTHAHTHTRTHTSLCLPFSETNIRRRKERLRKRAR